MNQFEDTTGLPEPRAVQVDTWTQLQPNLAADELHEGVVDRLAILQATTHLLDQALHTEAVELTPGDLNRITAGLSALAWSCWTFAKELEEQGGLDS